MDEILKEFLIESHENLDRLERDLVILEKAPHDKETLGSIFRAIHTLKGASGFLGFGKLEAVAHIGESLLSKLRDGALVINPATTGVLLATVDAIRQMLGEVELTGEIAERDDSKLIALLTCLNGGQSIPAPILAVVPLVALSSAPAIPIEILVPLRASSLNAPREMSSDPGASPALHSSIRVDVGLLDKLMNLVGELVLARNQVLQFTSQCADSAFLANSQCLNLITTELQNSVMKMRMQPISNVINKLPRLVRDLASGCEKQVRIEMEGEETQLDKTIIEAIRYPLIHIVRNSVDHGIERPEARVARGKPAEGCLKIRASHEGGQVKIEISDDGCGLDVERVKRVAVQEALITLDQASRMTEEEVFQLIFLPGFSTAEKITNVSGRGVGMDVVKTNIEKIGGTVDLQSQRGSGCTLKIKIPLTLAIIPALIVTSGGDRFAIPQASLLELVRLEGDTAHQRIEFVHGAPVYRLRDQLLPLVDLNREFQLTNGETSGIGVRIVDVTNIAVVQTDGYPFGLVVDEINDTEEIVVKPLGKQLKGITSFAGATIMGDGRVALILDVTGLAQRACVISSGCERANNAERATQTQKPDVNLQSMLLFAAAPGSRMAMPLAMVARLEEFPRSSIEYSGAQPVVRYRDQILPLIWVAKYVLSIGTAPEDDLQDPLQVVIYTEQERSVGLIVSRIDDIITEAITIIRPSFGNGILGSAVIGEKVTDLLDVETVIRAADPTFYAMHPVPRIAANSLP